MLIMYVSVLFCVYLFRSSLGVLFPCLCSLQGRSKTDILERDFFLILDLSFKMPSLFFVNDVHYEVYSDSCSKQCSLLFYFKACTLKKYISCLEAIQIVPILCFVFVGCVVLCIFVNISCRCYFFFNLKRESFC